MVAAIHEPGAPARADFNDAIAARSSSWYSACLRITGSPQLAEDAVQNALLAAWNKREQFNAAARLDTWIHRIVINSALETVRSRRRHLFTPLDESAFASDEPLPETARLNDELCSRLDRALARLTEIERLCFVLKHLEEWRLKEIAAELGVGLGAVKQALVRAVRKLRVSMAGLRTLSQ